MFLNLRPQGRHLTDEQAKTLDDEFFLSNPLSHFTSRIATLLEADRADRKPDADNEPEFFHALGLADADDALTFSKRERNIQVAIDAVALRHQAAEALTRFIYGVAAATPKPGDAKCIWLAIADSPTRMIEVIEANKAAVDDELLSFLSLIFPPGTRVEGDAFLAADTAQAWANHAIYLLTNNELSVNAANNKLKHGLAVSARDDVRIEFITTPPDADGNLSLSAFGEGKSVPIFDRPMLTYLSRPVVKPRLGVEAISLRVDTPVVLAETWMMANLYAAMFHIAALKHFNGSPPPEVAPYPKLVAGRLPEHVIGGRPQGYRSTVTTPLDEVTQPRPDGVFFHRHFQSMQIDFDSRVRAQVVEG